MAEPKISPPIQVPTAPNADIPSVVTGPKEKGNVADISDYLKPSEQAPNIPPEVGEYLKSSENPEQPHEIIKSNIEVPQALTSPVQTPPEITNVVKARKIKKKRIYKDAREANTWVEVTEGREDLKAA